MSPDLAAELSRRSTLVELSQEEFQQIVDAAVLMKVLPKFHGSRAELEVPLRSVLAWCISPDSPDHTALGAALDDATNSGADIASALDSVTYALPNTAHKAARMLRNLLLDGFAAFS